LRTYNEGAKVNISNGTSHRRTTNRVRLTAKIQSKINIPTHCPSGAVDSTMYDLYCEKYKRCRRCIQDPSLYRSYKVHMLLLSPSRTKSSIDIAIVPIKKLDVFHVFKWSIWNTRHAVSCTVRSIAADASLGSVPEFSWASSVPMRRSVAVLVVCFPCRTCRTNPDICCQPGTLVHKVYRELHPHVTLSHLLTHLGSVYNRST
jgi:hypothetical protein